MRQSSKDLLCGKERSGNLGSNYLFISELNYFKSVSASVQGTNIIEMRLNEVLTSAYVHSRGFLRAIGVAEFEAAKYHIFRQGQCDSHAIKSV
ncbi:unnamed protein product [Allacma fusca]|uniref:Uncharacterized protein n=1 Tax=Allacma fusca TaxID=39272 RepID=A0A8J2KPR3_9HEXA|nr:unnamed protein product [Allacma fusca]